MKDENEASKFAADIIAGMLKSEPVNSSMSEKEEPTKAPTEFETYAGTLHVGGDALGHQRMIDKWIENEKNGIPPISGKEKIWRLKRYGVIESEPVVSQDQEERKSINPSNKKLWEFAKMIFDKQMEAAKRPDTVLSLHEIDRATIEEEWFNALEDLIYIGEIDFSKPID